jgi:hypothetical protein
VKKIFLFSFLLLCGCSTVIREVQPSMTATQQYLIAQSAINAADQIKIKNPAAFGKVYIDSSNFDGSKFTYEEIQAALLRNGVAIVNDPKLADTIISIRVGVQSIDNRVTNMGLPSIPIPFPIPMITFATPAVTILSKDQNIGITLIGLTAWNAHTGLLVEDLGEKLGLSYNTIWSGIAGTAEHNDFYYLTVPQNSK